MGEHPWHISQQFESLTAAGMAASPLLVSVDGS